MSRHAAGRVAKRLGVVAAGLALGAGAMAYFRANDGPRYQPQPPSARQFALPAAGLDAVPRPDALSRPDDAGPGPATEPVDARAALISFLRALADGKPEQAYPLLDGPGRKRFPLPASWIRAQADFIQPLTFEVGTARPAADRPGVTSLDVAASHRPSLDPVRGLVPGHSQSVWDVSREGDVWRVAAEPGNFRPVLPTDASATVVVQGWVDRLATCDTAAAAQLQVVGTFYGSPSLSRAPCDKRGAWSAGAPVGLDRTPDPKAFLAAFGPEVANWARLVPVQGPDSKFLAAVAPMGDSWQVMGVAVAG